VCPEAVKTESGTPPNQRDEAQNRDGVRGGHPFFKTLLDLAVHIYEVNPVKLALTETSSALSNATTLTSAELSRLVGRVNFALSRIRSSSDKPDTNIIAACDVIQMQLTKSSDTFRNLQNEKIIQQHAESRLKIRQAILEKTNAIAAVKLKEVASLTNQLSRTEGELRVQVESLLNLPSGATNAFNRPVLTNLLYNLTNAVAQDKTHSMRAFIFSARNPSIPEDTHLSQIATTLGKYLQTLDQLTQAHIDYLNTAKAIDAATSELDIAKKALLDVEGKIVNLNSDYQLALSKSIEAIETSLYQIEAAAQNGSMNRRRVSTASRTFTFYSTEELRREYLSKRVLPHDIMAFPEPEEEAEKLFGKRIARHYYVVRLSVRNPDAKQDKLISTGMIRAKGRALVEAAIERPRTKTRTNDQQPSDKIRFTVPVEVAPHSAQQVYAVLTDNSVDETRAITFRALEMAGSIASAYALSFNVGTAAKDAVQLATGVGVPAFSKFWTDRMPGYERNVVNFAMEDLVKVPKGGVASHKFLFFPKDKIEAIIIDQYSYGKFGTALGKAKSILKDAIPGVEADASKTVQQPDAFVAYLTFDNLDVPYEHVFQVEEQNIKEVALRTLNDLREVSALRDNLAIAVSGNIDESTLFSYYTLKLNSITNLTSAGTFADACNGATTNLTERSAQIVAAWPEATNYLKGVEILLKISKELLPEQLLKCVLITNRTRITAAKNEAQEYVNMGLGGRAMELYSKQFEELKAISRDAVIENNYYLNCVELIANKQLTENLAKLQRISNLDDPKQKKEMTDFLIELDEKLRMLKVARMGSNRLMPAIAF